MGGLGKDRESTQHVPCTVTMFYFKSSQDWEEYKKSNQ